MHTDAAEYTYTASKGVCLGVVSSCHKKGLWEKGEDRKMDNTTLTMFCSLHSFLLRLFARVRAVEHGCTRGEHLGYLFSAPIRFIVIVQ